MLSTIITICFIIFDKTCKNKIKKILLYIIPISVFAITTVTICSLNYRNYGVFTLNQYRDAIIDMCDDYSIPVLDLYAKGGCHPNIGAWRDANLPDGLHPNQAYYRKLALQIAQFIQTI